MPRNLKYTPKEYAVYLITNKVNGKQYVGITVTGLRNRWVQHTSAARSPHKGKRPIAHAIKKYGEENFSMEHIASAVSWDELLELEKILIAQYSSKYPAGYNLTDGGEGNLGGQISERARRLTSERFKGKKLSEEHKIKLRIGIAASMTQERRAAISERTKIRFTEDKEASLKKFFGSRLHSDEWKKKLSASTKGRQFSQKAKDAALKFNKGRKLSPEEVIKRTAVFKEHWRAIKAGEKKLSPKHGKHGKIVNKSPKILCEPFSPEEHYVVS